MSKKAESLLFIAVALAVVLSLRFFLTGADRTSREYEYASALNLEEQETQVADNTKEDARQDENLDDTDPDDSEPEQGEGNHYDTSQDQERDGSADRNDSQTIDNQSGAGNGNGEGAGEGGNGGDTGGNTAATPAPTQIPPAAAASPSVTETPKPTREPEEKLDSIKVEWPGKDEIFYNEDLGERKKKIVVTAVYESGKETVLNADQYVIRGLSSTNKGCGQHTMTVSSGGKEYQLTYTVNNWIRGIRYEWDEDGKTNNGMKLYKGEMIWDEVLYVYALMADETEEDLDYGEYNVEGLDPNKTGVVQNFTITYPGCEPVKGTCQFNDRVKTTHIIYCDDSGHQNVLETKQEKEYMTVRKDKNTQIKASKANSIERDGKTYTLDEQTLTVDGKSKSLPYTLNYGRREFQIDIYQYYVYDSSKNIASIRCVWRGDNNGVVPSGKSLESQIKIIAVMENGDERELKYSACEVTGFDETLIGEKQTFRISYKDWSVTGTCTVK